MLELAQMQQLRFRAAFLDRVASRRSTATDNLSLNAIYDSYNVDLEAHSIILDNGKTVDAVPLTNAGLTRGDRVSVGRGSRPFFKSMPA